MEDNSAVVTMANNDSGYTKKCKHFLMVLNYIKEQITLGQIEARKIYGKLNTADMHTKPLRSSAFLTLAHKILGQPPPHNPLVTTASTPEEIVASPYAMDAEGQPRIGAKRSLWASSHATATESSPNAQRRKAHILRYITPNIADSQMDTEV
jgi:hypothetical protein